MDFFNEVSQYLRVANIDHSTAYLEKSLKSHPDYPSLVSFTDYLDELGVPYNAVIADKERYADLTYPLFAHLNTDPGGEFKIILSATELEGQSQVKDKWDGIALMIEKNYLIQDPEHQEHLELEIVERRVQKWFVISACVLLLAAFISNFSVSGLLLLLIGSIGIFICSLIVLKNLGTNNNLIQKICSSDGGSGCNKILEEKKFKFGKYLDPGDIGLIYFFTAVFSISCLPFFIGNNDYSYLIIPSSVSALVSILSIYYQLRIAKSWCRLCLTVIAVLWALEFILYRNISWNYPLILPLLLFSVSYLFFLATWTLGKSIIFKIKSTRLSEIRLLRWKRDPKILIPYLFSQRMINMDLWKEEILIGNPSASMRLIIACNPFCNPCANAHKVLHKLISRHPDQVCLAVRFTISKKNQDSNSKAPLRCILNAIKHSGNVSKTLDDWFEFMDVDKFKSLYPTDILNDAEYGQIANLHSNWSDDMKINYTPTLFVNGFELDRPYGIGDLPFIINQIQENITSNGTVANAPDRCDSPAGFQKR